MSVRAVLWHAGAPIRSLLIGLVRLYQATLSGVLGGQCRFYPSCSHFAEDAIRAHGAIRGTGLTIWRVLRCNPFGPGGIDRVPPRVALHDAVIQDSVRRTEHEMTGA